MLINTLSRNETLRSQLVPASSKNDHLFATVLSQLMKQKEIQMTVPQQIHSFVPNFDNVLPPSIYNSSIPLNNNEPLRFQSINAEKLNQVLEGKLNGMGDAFIGAGKRFNINPALLAAIAQHESGNGKSRAANEKNNIAGMMGATGLKSYSKVEDSIMDMARNLSKNYLGLGLSNIAKIGAKYAPIHAKNDPTGLNNHWVAGVTKYFEGLEGDKV
ncbi:conjugal transfer protein [Bacillus sp. AFS073361]|nr:conjugal transfer protein [Bacillus sp. AFS073361]